MEGPRTAGHVYRHLQEDELTDSEAIKRLFFFLSVFFSDPVVPSELGVNIAKSLPDYLE